MPLDVEDAPKYINSINFKPIINRLIKEKGWLKEEAAEIVELYKRFLFLHKKYGDQYQLAPSPEMDEVWHAHILYTKDYNEHCMQLYGKFLHHQPEEPLSPDNSATPENVKNSFTNTQSLYLKEYGEHLPIVRSYDFLGRLIVLFIKSYRNIEAKYRTKEETKRQ